MEEKDKDLGGRPPMFESPQSLQAKVDEYFVWIQGDKETICDSDDEGKPVDREVFTRWPEPPTITGLCLFLGFESRQSFYDYGNRDGFSYTIKRARLRVENEYEKAMQLAKNPTGHIFALKNLGWSDKQEIDHTTGGEKMEPTKIIFGNGDKT